MIDLRTLSPYDWEAIRTSVEKTSRVMVAHEDSLSWGYGAEISARIAASCSLPSTPRSAASARSIPGSATTRIWKSRFLPQVENIVAEADRVLSY